MSTHPRSVLTSDGVPHEAEHSVPCWCGATDAPRPGINVISSAAWTPGGIAGVIEWLVTVDRMTLPKYARNLAGDGWEAPAYVAPVVDLTELSEPDLMAAWTASDEAARVALDAETTRRDEWQSTESTRSSVRPSIDAEYAAYLHSQYIEACTATRSYMVNPAGLARGYDGGDFFKVGRRPSVEKWGTDELRAWFGSGNAVQSDTRGTGHVLSKTEYAAALVAGRELVAA